MDMLYSRYSNPLELMNTYINQGRFGDFVSGFCEAEYNRKKEEAEKENENKLWSAWVNSHSDMTFGEWKNAFCKADKPTTARGGDESLDEDGIKAIMNNLFHDNSSQRSDE